MSQKWKNRATSADCRPRSAPILADFLVGRRLFCRSNQVKIFVDRSADFQRFLSSVKRRAMVARQSADFFEDFFIMISTEGPPIIGRQSADDRQTVGLWHYIKEPSADRRRISVIARLSADYKLWFVLFILFTIRVQCIHINYEIYHAFFFILGFISFDLIWPRVQVISGFCVGFSNWTLRMTFQNKH